MTTPRAAIFVLFLSACGAQAGSRSQSCPPRAAVVAHASRQPSGRTRNVIVVTIDGVRWQDVFGGIDVERARVAGMPACAISDGDLTPNLHRYFAAGGVVIGAPGYGEMVASGPSFVSLPGYEEIFTGRTSTCTSNFCDHISAATIVDELRAELRLGADRIAVVTSWETIARAAAADERALTISAGRHGGVTRDGVGVDRRAARVLAEAAAADAYPGWFDYRPDRYTAPLALEYLATERPRFLFVGLGDTDEYAHRHDYAGYAEALRAADAFVGKLMTTLATLDGYGAETTVIVTTDHGRAAGFSGHGADAPESRRVWMFAAGGAVPALGFVDGSRVARLADIAPTIRAWMGLAADTTAGAGVPLAELAPSPPTAGPLFARRIEPPEPR
ncbi:MAG TPA: alkaline phosphatase family protein [Polyangia bacterium]|jgi:hypothetical protein